MLHELPFHSTPGKYLFVHRQAWVLQGAYNLHLSVLNKNATFIQSPGVFNSDKVFTSSPPLIVINTREGADAEKNTWVIFVKESRDRRTRGGSRESTVKGTDR